MNMLLSHPDLCKPTGETAQVFKGRCEEPLWRILQRRVCYDFPLRVVAGHDLFDSKNLSPRPGVSRTAARFIDSVLHREKVAARTTAQNKYKFEGVEYRPEEVEQARLLAKNVNGIVFMTDALVRMYPDATFFGLMRDGRALCESHIRRGKTVERVARMYRRVGGAIVKYRDTYPSFHVVRFEDLIQWPTDVLDFVYAKAGLPREQIRKVRLQIKEKTSASGDRQLGAERDRKVVWYEPDELSSYFDPEINEHQIEQLDDSDRVYFEERAGDMISTFGYDMNGDFNREG
jgi:hypothetical protein